MRATILAAAQAVLLVGCGFDSAPTASDETGLPAPENDRRLGARLRPR